MEVLIAILSGLSVLGFLALGWFLKSYFPAYLSKKAENLATKEDIDELTHAVEGIKAKYATDLEILRADLAKANHVQQIQFKTEFDTYVSIMEKLVNLQSATFSLRPEVDAMPEEEEAKKKERVRRLTEFWDAYGPFWLEARSKRPFYSAEIWEKLEILLRTASLEARQFQWSGSNRAIDIRYWDDAEKNRGKILELIEEVCFRIRSRFDELKAVK